jgi:hypothetical protein
MYRMSALQSYNSKCPDCTLQFCNAEGFLLLWGHILLLLVAHEFCSDSWQALCQDYANFLKELWVTHFPLQLYHCCTYVTTYLFLILQSSTHFISTVSIISWIRE